YCDAKQVAQFIAKEINNTIKRAKQKIYRGQNNAKSFPGCKDQPQCTFSSMGVSLQPMTIFMQLDYMGPQILLAEMQKGSFGELKSFSNVTQGTKPLEGEGANDLSGFDYGAVHLGGTFKGCGKYYVKIDGAAQVINNEVQLEGQSMIVTVSLIKERVVTKECENAVQNVPNFLPLDEKYTKNSSEIWPGLVLVETDKLKKAGETFAKTLFKADDERIVSSRQNNNLKLALGPVDGGLVKVSVEGAGNSDEAKLVTVQIADIAESEIDKVAKEAAEAVYALKSGIVKGCIDPNDPELYFIIEQTEFIDKLYGKLEIASAQKSIKINTQETCMDFNVTRSVADTVTFKTDFIETSNASATIGAEESKTGIEAVRIRDSKGNLILEEFVNGTGIKNGQVKLVQPKKSGEEADKKKPFIAQMKLCIDGSDLFALAPENIGQIKVWATSTNTQIANRETDPPLEVKIEACGVHPIELVKKMSGISKESLKKGPQDYYAFVAWNGKGDETVKIAALRKYLAVELAKEKAGDQFVAGAGAPTGAQKKWKQDQADKMLGATGSFMVGCSIVPGVEFLAGFWNPAIWRNAFYDLIYVCGLPSLIAARNATRLYGDSWAAGNEIVDTITKFLAPIIMGASFLFKGFRGLLATAPAGAPLMMDAFNHDIDHLTPQELIDRSEAAQQSFWDSEVVNEGFYAGWVGKAVNLGADAGTILNAGNVEHIASKYRNLIKLDNKFFMTDTVQREILDEMEKEFAKSLRGQIGKGSTRMSQKVLTKMVEEAQQGITPVIAERIIGGSTKGPIPAFKFSKEGNDLIKKGITSVASENMDSMFLPPTDARDWALIAEDSIPPPATPTGVLPPGGKGMSDNAYKAYIKQVEKTNATHAAELKKWRNTKIKPKITALQEQARIRILEQMKTRAGLNSIDDVERLTGLNFKSTLAGAPNEAAAQTALRGKKSVARLAAMTNKQGAAQEFLVKSVQENKNVQQIANPKAYGKRLTIKQKFAGAKSFLASNWKSLAVNIIGGVATGVLADYLGSLFQENYWKSTTPLKEGQTGITGSKKTLGVSEKDLLNRPIINIDELRNGTTYKITATVDDFGRIGFAYYEVPNEELGKMTEAIKKNPKMAWEGDCKMFATEPAPKSIGELVPEEKDGISAALRLGYYNNAIAIHDLSHKFKPPLPEWIIMAVLSVEPSKIPECNMPNNWYLEMSEEKRKTWLKCVVKQIKEKGVATNAGGKSLYKGVELRETLKNQLDIWEKTQWVKKVA
ncbi:MAG: hypothetical protein QGI60_05270, partial [archaeon]|nr:hypothetical protein [archaeon]